MINNNIPTRKQPTEESPAKLFTCYNGELSVGKQSLNMSNLTRDVLIKTIVATEMQTCDSPDYSQQLKKTYHKWEHESSSVLCQRFNQIQHTNITVDLLTP